MNRNDLIRTKSAAGEKHADLARLFGLTPARISQIVHGRNARYDTRLCVRRNVWKLVEREARAKNVCPKKLAVRVLEIAMRDRLTTAIIDGSHRTIR